jgi:hypothetical protein
MYVRDMQAAAEVDEGIAMLRAGYAALAAASLDALTATELWGMLDELQTLACQLPTQWHRGLARLQTETTPRELGAKSWNEVLRIRWRLSTTEAGRRVHEAADLGPRRTLIGLPLAPVLPATAAARAAGSITAEHVEVIRTTMGHLPSFVGPASTEEFEADLVRLAVGVGPKELHGAAARALFLLDQDGPEPEDTERARKRGLTVGKQGRDGMIPIKGHLTPEAWATWEAIFARYAAPGTCNPDDPEPCVSGTPTQTQLDADQRTRDQRQHDALTAAGRIALMSGGLGQLNGLPVSVIIRTTLQDLESRAGVGVTGGGTLMPIADVIRMAAHANHYLAVFDKATGSALNLFRGRRTASPAQRIMLIARDGGCTKPCCPVGAYGSQVHHAAKDWNAGGLTNVDDLALACGPDNRMVGDDAWHTSLNAHHEVEWDPPRHLDTGQARVNTYHQPERLLKPPDDEPEPTGDNAIAEPGHPQEPGRPAPPESPEPFNPWSADDPPEPQGDNHNHDGKPDPFDLWGGYTPKDPSGPAPPDDPEPLNPWAPDDEPPPQPESEQGDRDDHRREPFNPWADDDQVA